MLLEAIRALYAYHHRAMGRLLEEATTAGADAKRPLVEGEPPILDTLVHLCGTQRIHLDWWSGALAGSESFRRHFTVGDYRDIATVGVLWNEVKRDTEAYLRTLSEDALAKVCVRPLPGGQTREVPLWLSMLHVANHGTQHRSEVAVMLTALGRSPGDMELV